jgi:outer membrane immunogenic protein
MKLVYSAAAIAASLAATPAFAQEFGGPRIEARIGWDSVDLGVDIDGEGTFDEGASTVSYGAEAGYDLSFGSAILGAYAGVDFANAEVCDEVFGDDEACISAERNITVGARAGFAVTPEALIYAKAGYSNGRVRASYDDFGDIIDAIEESESRSGHHIGVGAELAFGPNFYGKAEYVRTNYSDFDVDATTTGSIKRNQVLAGIGFRF